MKIFVSHQSADSSLASQVDDRLRRFHRVDTYLDVRDPLATASGDDLGEYLRGVLGTCTHLMAIVSPATQYSWWVPWEIGVATEKDYPISSYSGGPPSGMPLYLKKWPYLTSMSDIDLYVSKARSADQTRVILESQGRPRAAAQRSTTREFHRSLKAALGQ